MRTQRKKAGAGDAENSVQLAAAALKREDYSGAAGHYATGLRKLLAAGDGEVRLESELVSGLANTAAETVDLRLIERARKAYDGLAKSRSHDAVRFRTLSALRLAALLEGDLAGAFFAAREALAVAPGPAEAALGEVNAAVAARLLGDGGAERLQLRRAWDLLRDAKAGGDDELRTALLNFVIEASATMPAEARKALSQHRSATGKTSGARVADRRLGALEAMASARLAEAGGDDDVAVDLYDRAFELWRAIGFDARAALVALDLRRLTGDESYATFVRSVASRAPKAWFAKQLRAAANPADLLSPAERVVLAHLINGDSAKSIGARLDRSPFTISNHTRKIFQAFGLNSRGKVIARCAELGITSAKLSRDSR